MTRNVNVPLLRKAVEWVEQQEMLPRETREWMQTTYVLPEVDRLDIYEHTAGCGTAYCVAGYIGAMVNAEYKDCAWADDGTHVSSVAREALGITLDQADKLFLALNTASDVRRVAETIAGERL